MLLAAAQSKYTHQQHNSHQMSPGLWDRGADGDHHLSVNPSPTDCHRSSIKACNIHVFTCNIMETTNSFNLQQIHRLQRKNLCPQTMCAQKTLTILHSLISHPCLPGCLPCGSWIPHYPQRTQPKLWSDSRCAVWLESSLSACQNVQYLKLWLVSYISLKTGLDFKFNPSHLLFKISTMLKVGMHHEKRYLWGICHMQTVYIQIT